MPKDRREIEFHFPLETLVETICKLPHGDLMTIKRRIEEHLKNTGPTVQSHVISRETLEDIEDAEFWDTGPGHRTPPPVGDFDLALAKEKIGRHTAIKGYVDLLYVVKHGTPERVEETVREAMEIAMPGGGFIIGSSDSFREGTPGENIVAYFEAWKKYGVYA